MRRVALAALVHVYARKASQLRVAKTLNSLVALTKNGQPVEGGLRTVAHEVCIAAQRLAGGCLEATLYVQVHSLTFSDLL